MKWVEWSNINKGEGDWELFIDYSPSCAIWSHCSGATKKKMVRVETLRVEEKESLLGAREHGGLIN